MTALRQSKPRSRQNLKAVIYCRVSSAKQITRGDGLTSQETRCREYARYKGYEVVEVYKDDLSGSLIDRPGMKAMLGFVAQHRDEGIRVIIDDISRLARGLEAHLQLRQAIGSAGGLLESPSIEFGEDSDSILVENLLASVSQHQRQKNGEQTINRMRARSLNGYWPFRAPIGYKFQRVSGHGNMLMRDEPYASILQEALEGYASGRFETQVEVKRFLERQPLYPKDLPNGEIRNQRISEILTRVLYAGYLEVTNWDVSLRPAQHEGLISFETYQRIQERLTGTAKAPARKDINADFPLRGFVECDDCGKPLTACWAQGKRKKYAYYFCPAKGCPSKGKSIPRDRLEGDFEELLFRLQPTDNLLKMAKAMFRDAWALQLAKAGETAQQVQKGIGKLDRQIEPLLDRIVDAHQPSVIAAYEKRIAKLEREKALAQEQIAKSQRPRHTFEESFEHAMTFLSSPWKIWKNGDLGLKKTVLRLAFSDRLAYSRSDGVRTPKVSLPFKVLCDSSGLKCEMAHPTGMPCAGFSIG